MKYTHLYIGTGEVKTQLGEEYASGFLKINSGKAEGAIFSPAFITREDAELFFGEGNYKRIDIK